MTQDRPSLDQRRARHAWMAVERASKDQVNAKEYGREAKRLPLRIRTSGLGQALAFLGAKNRASALLCDVDDWLLNERMLGDASVESVSGSRVLAVVVNGDARVLRQATEEALLYLQWLTRFAEAEIGIDDQSSHAED